MDFNLRHNPDGTNHVTIYPKARDNSTRCKFAGDLLDVVTHF